MLRSEGERVKNLKMAKKGNYNVLEMEEESNREKESEMEVRETCEYDYRIVCAAAHPCVELVHSGNRVHWGTLFMLLIWLHTKREEESCLDSIKKCNVVCILYLWVAMRRRHFYCCKVTSSSG